jgi:hypothetical protein
MYDTKIQTQISSKILKKAKVKASEAGFSSINDVIRMVVSQFADGKINFGFSVKNEIRNIDFVNDSEQKEIEDILRKIKLDRLDEMSSSERIDL